MTRIVRLAFVSMLLLSTIVWIESLPPVRAEEGISGSGERMLGVEAGDYAKYDIVAASWNSTDPTVKPSLSWLNVNNTEWIKSTVTATSGTNIMFELMWHFKNGTELTTVNSTDVSWGRGDSLWFVSANLSAGNWIHTEFGFSIPINKTTSRTYLDVEREVNFAGFGKMYVGSGWLSRWSVSTISDGVYWDRTTGIMCERRYEESSLWLGPMTIPPQYNSSMTYSLSLIDTNLWGPRIFPVTLGWRKFTVYAASNSSISNFEFNETLKQVRFNIRGFTGTSGYANVTIPGNLLWGEFSVFLDDSPLMENVDYTQAYNGTHYNFYITYSHSIHTIEIRATEVLDSISPIADAGFDQIVNEDMPVIFDGSGSSDNVGIVSYVWTFIDVLPRILTGVNPNYIFTTPGTFVITLNVTDATGNYDPDAIAITVSDVTNPVAASGPDQIVDVGYTVTFDGRGSSDNVGISSYEWDFGDGTAGTGITCNHAYTGSGDYTVTLTIRDAAGNLDSDTMTVTVTESPSAAFPWWVLGPIALVVAGIAIVIVLLGRRKQTHTLPSGG